MPESSIYVVGPANLSGRALEHLQKGGALLVLVSLNALEVLAEIPAKLRLSGKRSQAGEQQTALLLEFEAVDEDLDGVLGLQEKPIEKTDLEGGLLAAALLCENGLTQVFTIDENCRVFIDGQKDWELEEDLRIQIRF